MGAVPVVVVDPLLERRSALRGVLVGEAVGPLAQRRLDEALGLAVGLWPIRADGKRGLKAALPFRSAMSTIC